MQLIVAMVAVVAAVGGSGEPAAAMGTTIKVTTLADVVNGTDGHCSLREAVIAANTNTASGAVGDECAAGSGAAADVIIFNSGGTIVLGGTQLPVIDEDLEIDGTKVITIDANNASRVFEIDGATVTLERLALIDGNATLGGAIWVQNGGDLTVNDSSVRSSVATAGHGGGIAASDATLTVVDSLIDSNQGRSGGVGVLGPASIATITNSMINNNVGTAPFSAGAISNDGTMTISDSELNDNTGGGSASAGAIATSGILSVIRSEFARNDGPTGIGAIRGLSMAPTTIAASSFTENTGLGYGAISGEIDLTVIGSTFDRNQGPSGIIGQTPKMAIYNSTISGSGLAIRAVFADQLTLLFSTITDNSQGLFLSANASASIGASIIVDNSTSDITSSGFTGTFSSQGYNVIGEITGSTPPSFNGVDDITDVPDPLLGPLADNGGPVLTHALLEYAPAIDRVTAILSEDQFVDAIGTSRPQGSAKDAGAVEAIGLAAAICDGKLATINLNMSGVFVTGTSGDNVVFGTPGADDINGQGGDDTICGGAGADFIRGGSGDDTIFGDAGADTIRGGGGADSIFGGINDDRIFGQGGTDTIDGGSGEDRIDGQGAADTIDGGSGADAISGQNGGDTISGGTEDDVLKGQTGPDVFDGEDDDDEMIGGDGADTFYGGDGFDKCAGNTGPDSAEAASCEQTPGIEVLF